MGNPGVQVRDAGGLVPGGEREADRSILVPSITKGGAHRGRLGD